MVELLWLLAGASLAIRRRAFAPTTLNVISEHDVDLVDRVVVVALVGVLLFYRHVCLCADNAYTICRVYNINFSTCFDVFCVFTAAYKTIRSRVANTMLASPALQATGVAQIAQYHRDSRTSSANRTCVLNFACMYTGITLARAPIKHHRTVHMQEVMAHSGAMRNANGKHACTHAHKTPKSQTETPAYKCLTNLL